MKKYKRSKIVQLHDPPLGQKILIPWPKKVWDSRKPPGCSGSLRDPRPRAVAGSMVYRFTITSSLLYTARGTWPDIWLSTSTTIINKLFNIFQNVLDCISLLLRSLVGNLNMWGDSVKGTLSVFFPISILCGFFY